MTKGTDGYPSVMGRALVLNATYEPLGIVSGPRAVVLVLSEKADSVADSDVSYRSERLTLVVPSVVKLRYFVRVPHPRLASLSRRAVFHRDDYRCQYCDRPADSIDHVVPRSRGGTNTWENVVAACRRCNLAKGNRLLNEISMELHRKPTAPRHLTGFLVAPDRIPEQWKQYLGEYQRSA